MTVVSDSKFLQFFQLQKAVCVLLNQILRIMLQAVEYNSTVDGDAPFKFLFFDHLK
jgi:hypothetical protein